MPRSYLARNLVENHDVRLAIHVAIGVHGLSEEFFACGILDVNSIDFLCAERFKLFSRKLNRLTGASERQFVDGGDSELSCSKGQRRQCQEYCDRKNADNSFRGVHDVARIRR